MNLSFECLTSRPVLQRLRDVERDDPILWAKITPSHIAPATPASTDGGAPTAASEDTESELDPVIFADTDREEDDDRVSVDILIQSMISGEVPAGYAVADSGALFLNNESEVFERDDVVDGDLLAEAEQVEVEEHGRGKRRCVANTLYGSFEEH